jgi:hypothetical protein
MDIMPSSAETRKIRSRWTAGGLHIEILPLSVLARSRVRGTILLVQWVLSFFSDEWNQVLFTRQRRQLSHGTAQDATQAGAVPV